MVRAVTALGLAVLAAAGAMAAQTEGDAAHRADARRTAALNRAANHPPARGPDTAAAADYRRRLADYAAARADTDAAAADAQAAQADYRRRLRDYADAMARWRADVAAQQRAAGY